jgi:hypothetical protein
MRPDDEHETGEDPSNMGLNRRHLPVDRMRQFEGYVAAPVPSIRVSDGGWIPRGRD